MAEMTEPQDLLKHELADLLYAERRFVTATKTMARETNDPAQSNGPCWSAMIEVRMLAFPVPMMPPTSLSVMVL